jgi:hypothetical protein
LQVQSCQAAWGWDLWQCLESNQQTNKRGGEQQLHRQDAAGAGSACSPASFTGSMRYQCPKCSLLLSRVLCLLSCMCHMVCR